MNKAEVRAALTKLHAELESANHVDPDLTSLLRQVDHDIHKVLADATTEQGLADRVDRLAAGLAAEHPQAERFIRELIEALGKMGV